MDRYTFEIEGKTKEGTVLDNGEVHEEFYASEDSIAKALTRLCSIEDRGTE